ncbi:PPK2 family polyphosphate kinase [Actinomycetaceae bacterium MB13-C1-2]|nr:PPK2 family polyphosphate kinase [Actinomycetaceae bacterium MB13-C1-2]
MGKKKDEVVEVDYEAIAAPTLVPPGFHITDLQKQYDPARLPKKLDKAKGKGALKVAKAELAELQDKFYADGDRSLLVILQGMDAAGKDGTIKHVLQGVNPQGIDVYSFKSPSSLERSHDYLWRHEIATPVLGKIAIFNRSQYENVLVTKVHPEYLWPKTSAPTPDDIWAQRYQEINDWEKRLTNQGTVIVKLFLNLSKDEQARRFLSRVDEEDKNWKVSPSDMAERAYWDDYLQAFTDMLNNTSTEYAPWHVLPADHKWFLRLSTIAVILEAMREIDPQYPEVSDDVKQNLEQMRAALKAEL